ncbi:MAG: glycosyltransferase family 39 protein [Polyangiaceae bacterium]
MRGFILHASSAYGRWLVELWDAPGKATTAKAVDAAWSVNHEHPGLMKTLFALSNLLLHKKLGLFAMEGTSYRFPAMALSGGLLSLVYVWGAQVRSRAAGVVAAIALGAMPRFFFHAHLACFDAPIVALWTLCAYAFWRAVCVDGARRGAAARGESQREGVSAWDGVRWGGRSWRGTFGLALDTKHNSWFLPIVAVMHTAIVLVGARVWGARGCGRRRGRGGGRW